MARRLQGRDRRFGAGAQGVAKGEAVGCAIRQGQPGGGLAALVAGAGPGCYQDDELSALVDAPLVREDGTPLSLELSHPTDYQLSEDVRTCRAYRDRVAEGWYAMSSRDMAQEAFFVRACGVIDALADSREPRVSYFHPKTAEQDLASMAAEALPFFGEGDGAAGAASLGELEARGDASAKTTPKGEWIIEREHTLTVIQPLAQADFTGDGVEDVLVYVHVRALDGTASTGMLAVLTKTAPDAPVRLTKL